jgi:hypothetical protein
LLLNTVLPDGFIDDARPRPAGLRYSVKGRSFSLFRQIVGSDEEAKTKPERIKGRRKAPPAQPPSAPAADVAAAPPAAVQNPPSIAVPPSDPPPQ